MRRTERPSPHDLRRELREMMDAAREGGAVRRVFQGWSFLVQSFEVLVDEKPRRGWDVTVRIERGNPRPTAIDRKRLLTMLQAIGAPHEHPLGGQNAILKQPDAPIRYRWTENGAEPWRTMRSAST